MRRVATLVLLVSAMAAAQSLNVVVLETDVTASGSSVDFTADGGCMITAQFSISKPFMKSAVRRPWNGKRCTDFRGDTLRSAKLDVGVGDGGLP